MITTQKAAERLNSKGLQYNPQDVAELARKGILIGSKKPGSIWLIPEQTLERFIVQQKSLEIEDQSIQAPKQKKSLKELLRDPIWQAVGAIAGIIAVVPVVWGIITYFPANRNQVICASIIDNELQIRCLIETEAEAVLFQNIDRVMSIFSGNAIVKNATGKEWQGSITIRQRYESLLSQVIFTSLHHDIVELNFTENKATAKTRLNAEFFFMADPYSYALIAGLFDEHIPYNGNYEQESISIESEERWTFVKSQGIWKVEIFVYGLPPLNYHRIR